MFFKILRQVFFQAKFYSKKNKINQKLQNIIMLNRIYSQYILRFWPESSFNKFLI